MGKWWGCRYEQIFMKCWCGCIIIAKRRGRFNKELYQEAEGRKTPPYVVTWCGEGVMLRDVVDEYIAWLLSHMETGVRSVRGETKCGSVNTTMAYQTDLYQLCQYLEPQGLQAWSEVTQEQMAAYLLHLLDCVIWRCCTMGWSCVLYNNYCGMHIFLVLRCI